MKLCLLIVTAVAIATSYALPVPKEEVFTVYPVNSALAQQYETKQPEQPNTPLEADKAKVLNSETKVEVLEKVTEKPVEVKIVLVEKVTEESTVKEEPTTEQPTNSPVPETKSAPLKDASDAKVEETPATVAPTDETPTTVASNEGLRIVLTETVVATEPKLVVPENVTEERKSVDELIDKKVTDEAVVKTEKEETVLKSVESVKVEEKKEENVEVNKSEPKAAAQPEVKPVTEEMSEKLVTEPKAEVVAEPAQTRSASSDPPAQQSGGDVKSEEKVSTEQVAVKTVEVTTSAAVVEKAQESSAAEPKVVPTLVANDPEPQTEGKGEVKPTKVRAAPIIEDLKVLQPVEAEPATVAKIHVTVIQEEVLLDNQKNAPQPEVVKDAVVPVTEAEEKSTEVPDTTTVADEQKEKSDVVSTEKVPEAKDAVSTDKPSELKSVEVVVVPKPEAPKPVEISKEEDSKAAPEAVVIVMPSAKLEDVTTVVAVAENTDKPAETVEEKTVPEVRSAAASDELPEPATTAKAEVQQAKAVEGSSQPGASESAATTQEASQDQSDSVSTTVSSVTEQDTTTVTTTTTEPETVPTPAKQKAKKQAPPNFKGYSKRLKLQEAQRKQTSDSE